MITYNYCDLRLHRCSRRGVMDIFILFSAVDNKHENDGMVNDFASHCVLHCLFSYKLTCRKQTTEQTVASVLFFYDFAAQRLEQ